MSIVCDTDVLSAFAKIDGLNLLSEMSPKHKIVTSNGVYEELIFIKQAGYNFVDRIMKALWKTGIRSKEEVQDIMKDLETKDMMIINNKEKILK